MNENIPSEFLCPISNKLLKNPVTDSEGMTYEKDEILKHLITNSSSPITGKPLKISDLVPNFPLKIAIETQIKNFEAQKFSLKGMAQEKHILKWDFNPSVFSINIGVLLDSFVNFFLKTFISKIYIGDKREAMGDVQIKTKFCRS